MRPIRKGMGVFLVAAAVLAAMGCRPGGDLSARARAPGRSGKVRWLAPQEARRQIDAESDVFLLCVATKEEYDRGHIAGSVLIPVMGLRAGLRKNDYYPEINRGRTPRKDQPILCYGWWKPCRCPAVPTFSELAGRILLESGFQNVALLDGGVPAWIESPLPVEKSPTRARGGRRAVRRFPP